MSDELHTCKICGRDTRTHGWRCEPDKPSELSVATGWVPVSSAERLIEAWTSYAVYAEQAEHVQADSAWRAKAEAYRACAEQLRREMEAATERQPAPNSPAQTRAEDGR